MLAEERAMRNNEPPQTPLPGDGPTVKEYINSGMKNYFNMTQPKFGIKEYNCRNSKLEPSIFKIPNFAILKAPGTKDHFTDLAAKLTINNPSAKYG